MLRSDTMVNALEPSFEEKVVLSYIDQHVRQGHFK